MRRIIVKVPDDLSNPERLDKLLTRLIKEQSIATKLSPERIISRSLIEQLITDGRVKGDEVILYDPAFKVKSGAELIIDLPEPRSLRVAADPSVQFKVVYKDEEVLVVDKPAGLVVHPGAGNFEGTLVSGLVHYLGDQLPELAGAFRPGIVHRLDKNTSGLMVVALTEHAWRHLTQQFKPPRTITRNYLAVTLTLPRLGKGSSVEQNGSGTISLPIGRDINNRVKMAAKAFGGQEAVTHWSVDQELAYGAVLNCKLETGRTHQIRVHLAAAGAPIIGDDVYGAKLASASPQLRRLIKPMSRQALHAYKLSFIHPRTEERISFTSELPTDMITLINRLNQR